MAETVRVNIEADTQQAEANMNDVVDILNKINSNLDESKKGVEELGEETKENTKQVRGLANSFKGVGLAIKAIGIGLVLKAFDALAGVLESNQKFADGLSKVFTTINIVAGKLLESLEPVVDIFTNLGSAIKAIVARDFDALSNIGDNLVQSFKDLGNNVKDFAGNLGTTVTEANKTADALVKLRNEVELSEAKAEQLVQIYENEAEQLRQVRDDTRLTFEERIRANEQLGAVLQKQFQEELKQRNKRLELAKLELEQNKDSTELKKAVIEAETALFELQNRITGQRSEQRANEAALQQEAQETATVRVNSVNRINSAEISRLETTTSVNRAIQTNNQNTLNALDDAVDKSIEFRKQKEDELKQARMLALNAGLIAAQNGLGALTQLYEGNTKAQKNISIAQATIATFQGALNAFQAAQIIPPPFGQIIGAANAAAAIAGGFAQIRQIKNTNVSSSGSAGGGGGSITASAGGSFSQFTQANTPTISSIPTFNNSPIPTGGQSGEPIRAFVVENDITTAQNSQKALERRAIL